MVTLFIVSILVAVFLVFFLFMSFMISATYKDVKVGAKFVRFGATKNPFDSTYKEYEILDIKRKFVLLHR